MADVTDARDAEMATRTDSNMVDGREQIRLAVTVFERPASLSATVLALLQDGVKLEQFCLVALATTMGRVKRLARTTKSERPGLATLTEKLVDWPGAGIDRRIVATSNPLIAALPHVLGAGQIVTSHIHSPGDDGSAFSEHIRKGAIALIVGSKTPAQQASTTRLLLAQSAHGVKTYEFQMPQPPGQN